MRYVVTPAEMAALDAHTIREIGVPGVVLMERAALAVASEVKARWPGQPVLIACGPGNNGGDGLAAARILKLWGTSVTCYAPHADYKGDALIQYNAAQKVGVPFLADLDAFDEAARQAAVIVDGLFGTGLRADCSGSWAELIEAINRSGRPVLAVDIPSGIDGETGKVRGTAIRAACTVTFQYLKLGHCLFPGREHAGELIAADIGIAEERSLFEGRRVLDWQDAKFCPRRADSHKGSYGHVVVVAGSMGMLGAGALAARAAVRGGAGLVTWVVPQSLVIPASSLVTEVMLCPVPDCGGRLCSASENALRQALAGKTALVIGPGMSRNPDTTELIRNILHTIDIPMVVDADALFAVSGYPALFPKAERVLTPHPGEMARLLGSTVEEVEADRIGAVRRCTEQYGGTSVLKGATTLIASGGELTLNLTGNPGMATGGAGDVLAGLTGALLAQGCSAYEAASRACWLHGRAGDIAAAEKGQAGLAAGDIAECLPRASGGE